MTDTDTAEEALPSTAPAADLAARAEDMRGLAARLLEQAGQQRAEAGELTAAAQAEADRILSEARGKAQPLISGATAAQRHSEGLTMRSEWLDNAAAERERAAGAQAALGALEAERAALLGQLAGIGTRLERLAESRRELDGQHQAALGAEDLAAVASLNAQIGASDDLARRLEAERTTAQDRLAAIGDGEGLGELRDQRGLVGLGTVQRMLRDVWPDSDETARWRAAQELQATTEALLSFGRGEPPQQRQTVVRAG